MALTIIKNPSKYNFSKSPVICEVETDNYEENGNFGIKAFGQFYIPVGAVAGDYIRIVSTALTIQLDFINSVTPTVGKIRVKAVGDTFNDYWDKVLSDIQLNTSITTLYTVTQDELGGFFFLALNAGPQYSLNGSLVSGASFSFYNTTEGTDDIRSGPRPGYKIVVDLVVQTAKNSTFETILSLQKEPIVLNKVKFDFSKFVDACLEYYFPTPDQNTSNLCGQTGKEFYVTLKEVYGNPPTEQTVTVLPAPELQVDGKSTFKGYIIKGGLSPRWNRYLENDQLNSYVWDKRFNLTVRPSGIRVKKNQPEYLFVCLPFDVLNVRLRITTVYNDESTTVDYQAQLSGTSTKGSVICFPINHTGGVIDLKMAASTEINKFLVAIVRPDDHTLTFETEYFPDYEPLGDSKIFLFTNSLGGVDTFVSKGNFEEDVEFERENTTRIFDTDDADHLATGSQNQALKQDTFKVYSGWLKKEDLNWLEDLFLSKYRVEVLAPDTYMPITITNKKYKKHKTNQNLFGIEIEYAYQFKSPVTDRLAAEI